MRFTKMFKRFKPRNQNQRKNLRDNKEDNL